MEITYHKRNDLLYICLDPHAQEVVCRDLSSDVVIELGENDRIVGIEVLDASKRVDLASLPAVKYAEVA
jgi:uncharacterized protein YuzE